MGQSKGQEIRFDRSSVDACIGYLRNRTDENLQRFVSTAGSKLAYRHHLWSSDDSKPTIKEFWKKSLEGTGWNKKLETSIKAITNYIGSRQQSLWLDEVLKYLPDGHVFMTTVYLIGGYDNIVYGEDVALNLTSRYFDVDHREAVYYLIHELAHAGYFKYRQMPDLKRIRTLGDLSEVVKLLTHLEGMGVISPFRLRVEEGGLLDDDYKVLLNEAERNRRVRDYFTVLAKLEGRRNQKLRKKDFEVFEMMSGRRTRLWYIAGCHMAQKIEQEIGNETLRDLVKKSHEEFFRTYRELEDPLSN